MTKANSTSNDKLNRTAPVALFDLDYTLISSDCTAHWLRFLIMRSFKRKALVAILLPIIKLLSLCKVNLATRNSVYLWAATVGVSSRKYLTLRRQAAHHVIQTKGVQAYVNGLERLHWHQSQGHRVVVVTGALRWLARDVCKALGISYDYLLGSSEKNSFGGRVSDVFCYHQNKVTLLSLHGLLNDGRADYGYSDSAADIPMLDICEYKFIINPKPKCQQQFEESFGSDTVLFNWQKT